MKKGFGCSYLSLIFAVVVLAMALLLLLDACAGPARAVVAECPDGCCCTTVMPITPRPGQTLLPAYRVATPTGTPVVIVEFVTPYPGQTISWVATLDATPTGTPVVIVEFVTPYPGQVFFEAHLDATFTPEVGGGE
jgi:hypothetical protein